MSEHFDEHSLEDPKEWYDLERGDVASAFNVDARSGLTEDEARTRKKEFGANIIEKKKEVGIVGRILLQLKSPLVILLLLAAVATYLLDHTVDTIIILFAVGINVVIGVLQEGRASDAFKKLSESQERYGVVIRGGRRVRVRAENIVPGDVIVLEAGMLVPADVRLIHVNELEVNEASLTGESVPIRKHSDIIAGETVVSDQKNMAWMGTVVTEGNARGVVVATGKHTHLGGIAEALVAEGDVETPIQKSTNKLARFVALIAVAAIVVIVALGVVRGESFIDMLIVAIAVAVSAVPEGLPAAVTVVLAIGMEKLLAKGGLVRNLRAAETLGSTTVILTDKTGTLTQANMSVSSLITRDENKNDENYMLECAVYASDAFFEGEERRGEYIVRGRPIERAILLHALTHGERSEVETMTDRRLDFSAFSSEKRFASALVKGERSNTIVFTGAPEALMSMAGKVRVDGEEVSFAEHKEWFEDIQKERSSRGERLIGVAYASIQENAIPRSDDGEVAVSAIDDIVFAGLVSFEDPVRLDVTEAISTAKRAGARVVMVTGDNPYTALHVAQIVGIAGEETSVVHGAEFDDMSDDELLEEIDAGSVFARVLPTQKLRLAEILRERGEVVAMTGDGVNDAPALRIADIGVAVGSGTEVAKEASDLVLLKDSFAVIVEAIREGRRILDNLKRIVVHLLSTSFSEICLIAGALFFTLPLPILPAQILWMNIVQEGFLTFAFAFEPAEKGIMRRSPNRSEARDLITSDVRKLILIISSITGIFSLGLFLVLFSVGMPITEIRSLMFVALSLSAIFFTFSIKDFHRPVWKIQFFSNKYLLAALGMSIGLLVIAFLVPAIARLLSLTSLTTESIFVLIGVALFNLATIEGAKWLLFRKTNSKIKIENAKIQGKSI